MKLSRAFPSGKRISHCIVASYIDATHRPSAAILPHKELHLSTSTATHRARTTFRAAHCTPKTHTRSQRERILHVGNTSRTRADTNRRNHQTTLHTFLRASCLARRSGLLFAPLSVQVRAFSCWKRIPHIGRNCRVKHRRDASAKCGILVAHKISLDSGYRTASCSARRSGLLIAPPPP